MAGYYTLATGVVSTTSFDTLLFFYSSSGTPSPLCTTKATITFNSDLIIELYNSLGLYIHICRAGTRRNEAKVNIYLLR